MRLLVPVILLLVIAALACQGDEEASPTPTPRATQVLETLTPSPPVAVARTATPGPTATPMLYPPPPAAFTPRPTPTPIPSPEPVIEGAGAPSGCLSSSPNPYEAPVDLGEPTRYARGIYSIGLDGSGPALLVERGGAVVGTAAWNPLYQTYSATSDGSAVAFVAGQQAHPGQAELYLLAPVGSSEPRLLATFNEIWRLAIAPQGDQVAVQGSRGGEETRLYLVDTGDGTVTPIPLALRWPGGEPIWSPTGDWLAVVGSTGEEEPAGIYIFHADGSGLKRLADGGPPMAWSPDGSRIAFAIDRWQEGAGLYTTDLEGHVTKVSDTVTIRYPAIPSLAWSPDGRCIVFIAWPEEGKEPPIRMLDVETGWEIFLTNGVHPTWSPDGRHIAFLRDGNLWTMNVDGSQQTRLTNPRQPFVQEPFWLPDGSRLLFAFVPPMAGSVYVVNPDGTDEVNLADGSVPVWSPDGTKIVFRGGGSGPALGSQDDIYVMNSDGTGLHKIGESVQSDAIRPCMSWRPYAWSPDGRFVAYYDDRQGVMLAPADGGSEPQLLVNGTAVDWSPDGKRFVYSEFDQSRGECHIYLRDFQGASQAQWLTEGRHAVWSPDGQRIAFVKNESAGGGDVYVINVDGSGERKLMGVGSTNTLPLAWSPDGSRLAVATGGLFVLDPATGEKRKLSENVHHPPVWSPDGAQLAFTFWEGDGPSESPAVYVVNADGSGQPRKLTDGRDPSWSPDGRRIAFAR